MKVSDEMRDLQELKERLGEIIEEDKWHRSDRSESDGKAGNILEDLLEIPENNRRGADIIFDDGSEVELKTNKNKNTAVTFGGKKPENHIPQREQIETYGNKKPIKPIKVRKMTKKKATKKKVKEELFEELFETHFSTTFRAGKINKNRGLRTDVVGERVVISDEKTGEEIMSWKIQDIVNKIVSKCGNMVHVDVDKRKVDGVEEYNYKSATYYSGINPAAVRRMIESGDIAKETRSKIKRNNSIRDHGTVFRTNRKNLEGMYDKVEVWFFDESGKKKK